MSGTRGSRRDTSLCDEADSISNLGLSVSLVTAERENRYTRVLLHPPAGGSSLPEGAIGARARITCRATDFRGVRIEAPSPRGLPRSGWGSHHKKRGTLFRQTVNPNLKWIRIITSYYQGGGRPSPFLLGVKHSPQKYRISMKDRVIASELTIFHAVRSFFSVNPPPTIW